MRRREFITLIGGAAVVPFAALAQQNATSGRPAKIGVLWHAGSADEEREYLDVLMKTFGELGYAEGRNAQFLHRFPAEQPDLFRAMARELVEAKPDVIVAVTQKGAVEVKQATSTIPTVFVLATDPVKEGFVESLAHPGGNMTGLSTMAADLAGKKLTLLREAVPTLRGVALIVDYRNYSTSSPSVTAFISAANAMGLSVRTVQVATFEDVDLAFSKIPQDGSEAAIPFGPMLFNERARVGSSALGHRIPTLATINETVPYGLLMSYGQDQPEYFRKAAVYVDKILRGAKPADLPVQQPTRFKQIINLKAAKVLGLTIPASLLITADEVIE